MRFNKIFLSLLFILGIGIATANAQTTKDKKVTQLIKKKRAYNKQHGYGVRIQLDNGLEIAIKKTKRTTKKTKKSKK